jgi:hypothetical protein
MSTYDNRKSPIKNLIDLLTGRSRAVQSSNFESVAAQTAAHLDDRVRDVETGEVVREYPSGSALATAGAGTYTGALLAAGTILRDPSGAARTDTTDTAASLITALGLDANYKEATALIVNTADAAETITLAGGTGVTLKGAITVEQNTAVRLAILRTGAAAVTVRQV